MHRGIKILIGLAMVLALTLGGVVFFTALSREGLIPGRTNLEQTSQPTAPREETAPPTDAPTDAPADEPTAPPSSETQPLKEPGEFLLTFVGDCTLGSDVKTYGAMYSFIWTIGEDYDFPFRNVAEYFRADDFTMANLESVLADGGRPGSGIFSFRGPVEYTKILTGSSVEAVTIANNHAMDYHQDGYDSTRKALEEAGIAYAERDGSMLYTTDSGLTIGVYAILYMADMDDLKEEVARLREQGAEIVIGAFHWGVEGAYRPIAEQERVAHEAIDAGIDIIYGSHPHVLQKIEKYGDGIIYYSLGNFSFGGHQWPRDLDSVVLQQRVIRDSDGTVRLGDTTLIPVSITSSAPSNNYQPTPYEEGSEGYNRVLSKLDGSWTGPNLSVDYS